MTPKINSITVTPTAHTAALISMCRSRILEATRENSRKHKPPAIIIDQCVRPRHIISIDPYPTAPIIKRRMTFSKPFLSIISPVSSFQDIIDGKV